MQLTKALVVVFAAMAAAAPFKPDGPPGGFNKEVGVGGGWPGRGKDGKPPFGKGGKPPFDKGGKPPFDKGGKGKDEAAGTEPAPEVGVDDGED